MHNYKVPKLFFNHYQGITKSTDKGYIPTEQITRVARRYLFVNLSKEQFLYLMDSAVDLSSKEHWESIKGVVLSAQATVRQLSAQETN